MSKKNASDKQNEGGTLSEQAQALGRLLGQIMSAAEIEAECKRDLQDSNASSHNLEYFNQFKTKTGE